MELFLFWTLLSKNFFRFLVCIPNGFNCNSITTLFFSPDTAKFFHTVTSPLCEQSVWYGIIWLRDSASVYYLLLSFVCRWESQLCEPLLTQVMMRAVWPALSPASCDKKEKTLHRAGEDGWACLMRMSLISISTPSRPGTRRGDGVSDQKRWGWHFERERKKKKNINRIKVGVEESKTRRRWDSETFIDMLVLAKHLRIPHSVKRKHFFHSYPFVHSGLSKIALKILES